MLLSWRLQTLYLWDPNWLTISFCFWLDLSTVWWSVFLLSLLWRFSSRGLIKLVKVVLSAETYIFSSDLIISASFFNFSWKPFFTFLVSTLLMSSINHVCLFIFSDLRFGKNLFISILFCCITCFDRPTLITCINQLFVNLFNILKIKLVNICVAFLLLFVYLFIIVKIKLVLCLCCFLFLSLFVYLFIIVKMVLVFYLCLFLCLFVYLFVNLFFVVVCLFVYHCKDKVSVMSVLFFVCFCLFICLFIVKMVLVFYLCCRHVWSATTQL